MNTSRILAHHLSIATGLALLASCTAQDELDPFADSIDDTGFRQAVPATDDPLPQTVLDAIAATLVDGQDATVAHPELFPAGFEPNPEIVAADTEIWVTFVGESAAFQNSMGYFVYPTGSPPTSLTQQQLEDGLVFANASSQGDGGSHYNGVRRSLGVFQPGVQIGFYLVANGHCTDPGVGNCSTVGVDFTKPIYTTVDSMNPEHATDPGLARHVVMADLLDDPSSDARLLSFEDKDRLGYSDDDFDDVIFRVTASPGLGGDGPTIPPSCATSVPGFELCALYGGPNIQGVCWHACDDGTFDKTVSYTASGGDWSGFARHLADVDGDGDRDLCLTWSNGPNPGGPEVQAYCYASDGQGGFADELMGTTIAVHEGGNWSPYTMTFGDVDGDGDEDLCAIYGGVNIQGKCWLSDGDGTFTEAPYTGPVDSSVDCSYCARHLADVDGDGADDLCLTWSNGNNGAGAEVQSFCYAADGQGHFAHERMSQDPSVHQGGNWSPYTMQYADVDGDGDDDLCALYGGPGSVQGKCWLSDGDGTFTDVPYSGPLATDGDWTPYNRHLTDVDGDGDADLCLTFNAYPTGGGPQVQSYCYEATGAGDFLPGIMLAFDVEYGGDWSPYTLRFGN